MEARKIDLTPYPRTINLIDQNGNVITPKGEPYQIAIQLRQWLLAPARNINGEQLVAAWDVAEQIKGDTALLSEKDWQELCQVFRDLKGFGGDDAQTVLRVLRAPKVTVGEK